MKATESTTVYTAVIHAPATSPQSETASTPQGRRCCGHAENQPSHSCPLTRMGHSKAAAAERVPWIRQQMVLPRRPAPTQRHNHRAAARRTDHRPKRRLRGSRSPPEWRTECCQSVCSARVGEREGGEGKEKGASVGEGKGRQRKEKGRGGWRNGEEGKGGKERESSRTNN